MKFKLIIDKEREEELIIYSHNKDKFTDEIEALCKSRSCDSVGYKEKEAVILDLLEVNCFTVEDNKVFAITDKERLQVKQRIYMLEEQLPSFFIKINQSCIANIKRIARFDASIGGNLTVRFKNGYTDYVSRRNIKTVKERMGL